MRDWTETSTIQWEAPPPTSPPGFWPVRISKLLVLSILTLGIYELVWFWRNWRAINEAAPGSVNPYARTFFSGIMYFSLVERVGVTGGALLAIGYGIHEVAWIPTDARLQERASPRTRATVTSVRGFGSGAVSMAFFGVVAVMDDGDDPTPRDHGGGLRLSAGGGEERQDHRRRQRVFW